MVYESLYIDGLAIKCDLRNSLSGGVWLEIITRESLYLEGLALNYDLLKHRFDRVHTPHDERLGYRLSREKCINESTVRGTIFNIVDEKCVSFLIKTLFSIYRTLSVLGNL